MFHRMLKSAHRNVLAFTLLEVMAVSGIMASMQSQGGYTFAINQANQVKGINNLKQIHLLLTAQTIGEPLPKAAFFPKKDPLKDPTSIVQLIQGAPKELFVSPFASEALKKTGLTFVWNDTVNGKDMSLLPKDTWLLIDMAAFIVEPDAPKPSRYLLLYADGRAEAVRELPEDIRKVVAEAQAKLKAEAEAGADAEGAEK